MNDYSALANCLRFLSADAVQRANSGHPGMPMGMADVAAVLFTDFLKFYAPQPQWADRDRFVLSAGHGSMLLYSLLYLNGYPQMDLEQLKNFRQWGSMTAGHPEYGHAPGIETTTGPLGQGLANATGMAIAERLENARFGDDLVNHRTYVIVGDGCLSEGISHETASLAGHLQLSNLIVLFDDNDITIDGATSLSVSDDHLQRFAAYGWDTIAIDGHNHEEIKQAIAAAQKSAKPSLIACKTVIGHGAPNKQGSAKVHGSPLGDDEIAATREALSWAHPPFEIPAPLLAEWRAIGEAGGEEWQQWQKRLDASPEELRQKWQKLRTKQDMAAIDEAISAHKKILVDKPPTMATRKASEATLNALHGKVEGFIGGSADLTGSNNTKAAAQRAITAADFSGDYLHYGVREHAMGAAMNGMALHGLTPYGGTFLVFADYCRPSIRLSALMGVQAIYVMTHDSIGLGEDGPTHQPVEHLASLRAMPNISVYRPADAVETAECWQAALSDKNRPAIIALSRQNTPPLRLEHYEENLCARGAYLLPVGKSQHVDDARDLTILSSGTEVAVAMEIAALLSDIRVAVVSLPCWERFEVQDEEYRQAVLGDAPRFAIEAAAGFGWERYATSGAHIFAMSTFGASAPAEKLFAHFGFSADKVALKIRTMVESSLKK